jgi:hypothetical protein
LTTLIVRAAATVSLRSFRDGQPRVDRRTQLYDRQRDEVSLDEVEAIAI